ncbi:hypothetical protein HNQ60_003445 [Povalibacter uvarum]|uniref:DUF4382 domain-containing protein n=1 Tax=Povalibacter uvarum TaxID=732238 RepID=A0A841HR41_9GAMM|nr:DUF4382 domain-containing protein [Povalibacter uvarum]MBB6094558.1 hypothetical protein [Povalibacter uvarum]
MRVPVLVRFAAGAIGALMLAGCGSGGGDAATQQPPGPVYSGCVTPADCGNVIIAMTDADGDFLSYTVDVQSLTLKRANGDTVETLPLTTRIDFAQVVDLSEFLTSATVPNGAYVEGSLRLDYSNAAVTVESNGQPVEARVVGADGSPLGIVDVRVVLDNRNHLTVSPGRPSLLTLDFDLAASNTVDLTTSPATVTATPSLVASLEPVDEKDLRLRGPLVSVDAASSSYVVDVRPFGHRSGKFGQVTVYTNASTAFEVNGTASTGAAGLQALATAGAGTQTLAVGTLSRGDRRFDAQTVYAGTSVPGAGVDAVLGNVLSRVGDELIVRGGTLDRSDDGSSRFIRDPIVVRVSSTTKVLRVGAPSSSAFDSQDVSVGQRVLAFGSIEDEAGAAVLDATQGRVRMLPTHLSGTVHDVSAGNLELQLESIDGRAVGAFDFAGTGASADQDADPDSYEVSTGFLGGNLREGRSVRVLGFATTFGAAPPDFEARTVVDMRDSRSSLTVTWGMDGTDAPFSTADDSGLIVDLQNPDLGRLHVLRTGWRVRDLLDLPASPQLVPTGDRAAFVVASRGSCRSFHEFADFLAEIQRQLTAGGAARSLTAHGVYDENANVLRAKSIVVIL